MPRKARNLYDGIASFGALVEAALRAARGKRTKPGAAAFLANLEKEVLRLERELKIGRYVRDATPRSRSSIPSTVSCPRPRFVTQDEVLRRVRSWIAHAEHADTWRLRQAIFRTGWFHPAREPDPPRARCARRLLGQQPEPSAGEREGHPSHEEEPPRGEPEQVYHRQPEQERWFPCGPHALRPELAALRRGRVCSERSGRVMVSVRDHPSCPVVRGRGDATRQAAPTRDATRSQAHRIVRIGDPLAPRTDIQRRLRQPRVNHREYVVRRADAGAAIAHHGLDGVTE